MNIKYGHLFGIVLCVFIYSGCSKATHDMKTYQDKTHKISVQYPRTWTVKELPGSMQDFQHNVIVILQKAGMDEEDSVNIIFSVEDEQEGSSPSSYFESYLRILKETIGNVAIEKRKNIVINGQECQRIVYTARLGDKMLTSDQVLYRYKKKLYVLTLVAGVQDYDVQHAAFEKIVKTFKAGL